MAELFDFTQESPDFLYSKKCRAEDKTKSKINVYTQNKTFVCVQTPKMIVKKINSSGIELQFIKDSQHCTSFYDFISNFDQKNIEKIAEQSENWFGFSCDTEHCEEKYRPSIKSAKTKESEPSIKLNIETLGSEPNVKIYDNYKELEFKDIKIGKEIICAIYCSGIIVKKHKIYTEWKIKEVKCINKRTVFQDYSIRDVCHSDCESEEEFV
tara:strand:- start:74 stop:706 length:633 start_codon:yes stop_codon:yes gene_type:complete